MNGQEIEFTGCNNCLFLCDTNSSCTLQARFDKRKYMDERDIPVWDYEKGFITPKWCPLKKNDGIFVKIKK
jgi:hypothetical protein